MKKLLEAFSANRKTIGDLTPNQAIEVAALVFVGDTRVKWKITRQDKEGVWLAGEYDGVLYYCHITQYFEVFSSVTYPKEKKQREKQFDHNIGCVNVDWKDGVPYIRLLGWFLDNEFDVFAKYRSSQTPVKNPLHWLWQQ